jgi:ribosomal protein L40E
MEGQLEKINKPNSEHLEKNIGNIEIQDTVEELEKNCREKLADGIDIQKEFEFSSQEAISRANGSINLSQEIFESTKKETGVEAKIESLNKSAKENYEWLEKELKAMLADGISDPEKIREKMDDVDDAHRRMLDERRQKHEEEMKRLDSISEEDIQKNKEKIEGEMFGGKTLAEAKSAADSFLEDLKRKQDKFIKDQSIQNGGSSLRQEKEIVTEENERRLREMQSYADRTLKEAIQGVQQAVGEKRKTKICSRCGAESEISTNFCGVCGNKLNIAKAENVESPMEKIKKDRNFPELFQAIREIGPVRSSFGTKQEMVSPEKAIDIIEGLFNEDPRIVVEKMKQGQLLLFLNENGVRNKVFEIFQKSI